MTRFLLALLPFSVVFGSGAALAAISPGSKLLCKKVSRWVTVLA